MTARIKIDFVSDVSCPWCAVGLSSLELALARLDGEVRAEIHFQPFELNPDMPPEGQDTVERLSRKYGMTPEQVRSNGEAILPTAETPARMMYRPGCATSQGSMSNAHARSLIPTSMPPMPDGLRAYLMHSGFVSRFHAPSRMYSGCV